MLHSKKEKIEENRRFSTLFPSKCTSLCRGTVLFHNTSVFYSVILKRDRPCVSVYSAVLKCRKTLAEGACSHRPLLLVIALKKRKKPSEELALNRHIALEALGAVKREGSVKHLKTIKPKNVVLKI